MQIALQIACGWKSGKCEIQIRQAHDPGRARPKILLYRRLPGRKRLFRPNWGGTIHLVPDPGLAGQLVGRDHELSRLISCAAEATAGHGQAVLIEGEPGIGKSALVRAACAAAADRGCQVYWGAGDELGQALPLLPILDGLRVREPSANPRQETIVALLRGEVASGHGEDVPTALAEQLLALVSELCAARPMVLVVDDLQWADQASVTLWERLSRSARHLPLLLVGMMRPVPQREDLLALRHTADLAARFQLGGLPEESVTELVETLAGGKPDEELMRLADGAAGNPLYLTELVDALARSSSLAVSDAGTARADQRSRAGLPVRGDRGPAPLRPVLGAGGPARRRAAGRGLRRARPGHRARPGRGGPGPGRGRGPGRRRAGRVGQRSRVPASADPRGPVRGDPGAGAGRLAPRGWPGAGRGRARRPTG